MRINWDILKKSCNGTLNLCEQKTLEQWLGESAIHRRFYETIRTHYDAPLEKIELDDTELDAAWRRFSCRTRQRSTRIRTSWMAAASIAAAAVLCFWMLDGPNTDGSEQQQLPHIAAGTTQAILSVNGGEKILLDDTEQDGQWQRFIANDQPQPQSPDNTPPTPENIRIETPRGGEYRLQLPDGTMVWLNAETVIEYPSKFIADTRSIGLEGEAFFDVAHDNSRPFTIVTPDRLKITVLGTRFNVTSYLDVNWAQITLVEGSLAVSDGARELTLQPCQQVLFDRAERTLSLHQTDDASSSFAWTNGMFDFKLQPLVTILDAISKWYDIQIIYNPDIARQFQSITLQCERRSDFTHVMEILHKVTGLTYQIEDKSVDITF